MYNNQKKREVEPLPNIPLPPITTPVTPDPSPEIIPLPQEPKPQPIPEIQPSINL